MFSMDYYPGLQITIRNSAVWQDVLSHMRLVVLLTDFPAVFLYICNFDICHEIQIPKDEDKNQLSRAIFLLFAQAILFSFWYSICQQTS